ncbi:E3 ubiquitin-protein ligase At3g02290-like [Lycium barbarum]|uniref:E3 ubiquitin-protein ligase At3g02290-like n=1 Tax=Lycium barbarum TaxID=112863 RepID=UPI00293F5746|nr:E3 ubiquitin-protein ligase At3g02290-like [Lycium barbarum]XP_060215065.1 E3 ubiquitin-protein ligase At3g02290-like [Lycium barbarum]XP_060215066.1 E3 ubiquitin-protein ligase At3g02290-like [Lycium barbarum]XP_060215067.1 E3 ubiquitin-protein ligase At3g02290-like [Lycium barbarum]XP_060215068.1 E3 ubiquitin-protein ligase At3g02290-like [Lycium barbarum]
MGSVCCCFNVPDAGENAASNGQNHSFCQCFSCCFQNLINKCGTIFGQAQETAGTSASQGPSSSTNVVGVNSSFNTIRSQQDRGLPISTASRQPQMQQQDATLRRHDKGTSHSRVEPEPDIDADVEITQKLLGKGKLLKSDCEGGSKECRPESPPKDYSSKIVTGVQYEVSSSEDEDVCPTCLEEYTPENPKISTKCCHHYHLSCIYEWQMRSEKCPVCGKLMEFEETN